MIAQNAAVPRQRQTALGAEGGKVGVFPDELVQNGDGVQILRDDLAALGVLALAPDQAVVPHNQFICEAVLQHVGIIVYVIIGEDQGLFPFGQVQGVADHGGLAVLAGGFTPHVVDVHQYIAPVVNTLQNFVVLIHGDHIVVQTVRLSVCVEGQLGISDQRMEKQVLHHAVPCGVRNTVNHVAGGLHGGV
ncbi:hypothetical protein SDC9_84386 [bioreactor metagenome]|uniref:Uncharacterized protein n=1 Tax=bioreactor metagenome TaxID=1076179 RepID=A0A644ZAR2_9ZZZZ